MWEKLPQQQMTWRNLPNCGHGWRIKLKISNYFLFLSRAAFTQLYLIYCFERTKFLKFVCTLCSYLYARELLYIVTYSRTLKIVLPLSFPFHILLKATRWKCLGSVAGLIRVVRHTHLPTRTCADSSPTCGFVRPPTCGSDTNFRRRRHLTKPTRSNSIAWRIEIRKQVQCES